jgi:3-isopropylmalate/(R)-2-methylmalate dehydratase small subunit
MEPYNKHESVAALMNRSNVDTDQIIPKQFLKKVERSNKACFKDAKVLVVGDNFGCGSSREHAPWAIADYGFNTIISSSYADIFYNNCFKNSILPIIADKAQLARLMDEISANEGVRFIVDLENQALTTPAGNGFKFELDPYRKNNLLKGLDDIGLTLQHTDEIDQYEKKHKQDFPWLWV